MKLALAAVVAAAFSTAALADCAPDRVDIRGDWGKARFTVEVKDSIEERAEGMMNRPSMAANFGMIFVYDQPQRVGFWMRNTLIPLDMIFMSEDGVVQKVHENAVPLDETVIMDGDNIQYVLEIKGGMSNLLGIVPGSELRHPSVNQTVASWPCNAD